MRAAGCGWGWARAFALVLVLGAAAAGCGDGPAPAFAAYLVRRVAVGGAGLIEPESGAGFVPVDDYAAEAGEVTVFAVWRSGDAESEIEDYRVEAETAGVTILDQRVLSGSYRVASDGLLDCLFSSCTQNVTYRALFVAVAEHDAARLRFSVHTASEGELGEFTAVLDTPELDWSELGDGEELVLGRGDDWPRVTLRGAESGRVVASPVTLSVHVNGEPVTVMPELLGAQRVWLGTETQCPGTYDVRVTVGAEEAGVAPEERSLLVTLESDFGGLPPAGDRNCD